ncbi:hypothetical protein GCM10023094_30780 [Rhodococcus olei]|uniref:Uncharacterized protein n=1 Tax=Rhodococcus olei TaxID=2161675 RepID=A0ABP8P7W9_9NOCA
MTTPPRCRRRSARCRPAGDHLFFAPESESGWTPTEVLEEAETVPADFWNRDDALSPKQLVRPEPQPTMISPGRPLE